MTVRKNIFIIVGSAAENSSNKKIVEKIAALTADHFNCSIYTDLRRLPQFDTQLSTDDPPEEIARVRSEIDKADGVIICTPEYIFSIPSGLKNLLEWSVATTIFTNKPLGIITASLQGRMGHEELIMIMRTLMAGFTEETSLLIEGVKSKLDESGAITDEKTSTALMQFLEAFRELIHSHSS